MGANCCSFAPDQYDPYDSPIVSEALLHAADVVCCSCEMRQAFISFLLKKSWLPIYLERQSSGLLLASTYDLPQGQLNASLLISASNHQDTNTSLYRAKSELFRSKRTMSMNSRSESIVSQTRPTTIGDCPLPKQDPLLALAESFILFLIAGVLPHFLVSAEFLEWADARPLSSGPTSPRFPVDSHFLPHPTMAPAVDDQGKTSNMASPRISSSLRDEEHELYRSSRFCEEYDVDYHHQIIDTYITNNPSNTIATMRSKAAARRSSSISLYTFNNQVRSYFGRQSVALIAPLLTTFPQEQKVHPMIDSLAIENNSNMHETITAMNIPALVVSTTDVNTDSGIVDITADTTANNAHHPATAESTARSTTANNTHANTANSTNANSNKSSSGCDSKAPSRMEQIIHEVLSVINVTEIDDMLQSTFWLRDLLQLLDTLPLSIAVSAYTTKTTTGNDVYTADADADNEKNGKNDHDDVNQSSSNFHGGPYEVQKPVRAALTTAYYYAPAQQTVNSHHHHTHTHTPAYPAERLFIAAAAESQYDQRDVKTTTSVSLSAAHTSSMHARSTSSTQQSAPHPGSRITKKVTLPYFPLIYVNQTFVGMHRHQQQDTDFVGKNSVPYCLNPRTNTTTSSSNSNSSRMVHRSSNTHNTSMHSTSTSTSTTTSITTSVSSQCHGNNQHQHQRLKMQATAMHQLHALKLGHLTRGEEDGGATYLHLLLWKPIIIMVSQTNQQQTADYSGGRDENTARKGEKKFCKRILSIQYTTKVMTAQPAHTATTTTMSSAGNPDDHENVSSSSVMPDSQDLVAMDDLACLLSNLLYY